MLILLAAEFEIEVREETLIKDIIDKICKAPDYDEETGKAFLGRIQEEIEEENRDRERDRLEQIAREERQFELEKLK